MSFNNWHEINSICKRLERTISRRLRDLDEKEILSVAKMILPASNPDVQKLQKLSSK